MSDIIKVATEREEFDYLEDGFLYYFPKGGGCMSSHHLRQIADELDRRNEAWAELVDSLHKKKELLLTWMGEPL